MIWIRGGIFVVELDLWRLRVKGWSAVAKQWKDSKIGVRMKHHFIYKLYIIYGQ
jgi:hypothetical protein